MNYIPKVGDLVTWVASSSSKHYQGICAQVTQDIVSITFGKDSSFYKRYGLTSYTFVKNDNLFIKTEEPKPIEQRINDRIKKLWNESNYIKANPTQAY